MSCSYLKRFFGPESVYSLCLLHI
nr:hypothetical protein [Tanacetum cinerariifolium]